MNDSHPEFESSTLADPHDRLMDRALAEVISGEAPPNLTERIMAAAANQPASASQPTSRRWRSALLAIAASLVAAASLAISQYDTLRDAVARLEANHYKPTAQNTSASKDVVQAKRQNVAVARSGESRNDANSTDEKSLGPGDIVTYQSLSRESTVKRGRSKEAVRWNKLSSTVDPTSELVASAPSPASDAPSPYYLEGELPVAGRDGYRFEGRAVRTVDGMASVVPLTRIDGDFTRPGIVESLGNATQLGIGPQSSGDQYTRIHENPFVKAVGGDAVSTFSIDVDTASYANVRQFLMDMRQLPPPDAVRIEELINYFHYDYAPPASPVPTSITPPAPGSAGGSSPVDGTPTDAAAPPTSPPPFAAHVEVAACPWASEHRLVRIGIKGREISREKRPPSNLVFLVDVSGSMDEPNKLPLVVDGLRQLTRELGENDRVAIVVYASTEGLALESTRGDKRAVILAALDHLKAGGSTAGGAGIQLAYQIAEEHFIPGGTNRVILCTDGDFNVGVTSTAELERLVTQKALDTKVFLSVLGFGRGNLNDAMMQTIADRGNGNHHYVDNLREARKVLVEEMTGTLITIAKDVKIQVEFNPAQAAAYRLLGYENRLLRTEDFNDDTKDAGEIGAGHTVTALYEVIPAGQPVGVPAADALKYQPTENVGRSILSGYKDAADTETAATAGEQTDKMVHPTGAVSGELLTLKMRFKEPEGDESRKLEWPVTDAGTSFSEATDDFRFAAAVASFGLELRGSEYRGNATLDAIAEIAASSLGRDAGGYRTEFIELVRRAKELGARP
jgi:Ca-activated chloride channel family protein